MFTVPLVDSDLSSEEANFRIVEATRAFWNVAEKVFSDVNTRTVNLNTQLDQLQRRSNAIREKISLIAQSSNAQVLHAPSTFPSQEVVPANRLFPSTTDVSMKTEEKLSTFSPTSRETNQDVKAALAEKKIFFSADQISNMVNQKNGKKESVRSIPKNCRSVVDIFYYGENESPYVQTISPKNGKTSTSRISKAEPRKELDEVAIGVENRAEEPFPYKSQMESVQDLRLPDLLPQLADVALDMSLFSQPISTPALAPPISEQIGNKSVNPVAPPTASVVPVPEVVSTPTEPAEESRIPPPPVTPKDEPIPVTGPVVPVVVPTGAPPPPPPPPPPMLLAKSPAPPVNDSRSDLMASIRAAGGTKKAGLKSPRKQAKNVKSNLKDDSALPSESKASPGDLMSSLAKALDARRKAISGKSDSAADSKGKSDASGSGSIPPPPFLTDREESDDNENDWS